MGVERPTFTPTRLRVGYHRAQVDEAVDRIMTALAEPRPSLSPADVAAMSFTGRMYRPGYVMGEVDDWLDEVMGALGGRPVEAPSLGPIEAPSLGPAVLPADQVMSQAARDRRQAAAIIVVVLVVTVMIYTSRF